MKKLKFIIQKFIVGLMGSPIKIDPNIKNRQIKTIASLPKAVFWDTSVKIYKTKEGIEYVKTPEKCFSDLPDYNFNENYCEINGLKMHYIDAGPSDGKTPFITSWTTGLVLFIPNYDSRTSCKRIQVYRA